MGNHKPILIDYAKCAPCSSLICVDVCPLGVLEAGKDGKPQIFEVTSCTRCGVCVDLCPETAIIINQDTPTKAK